MIFTTKAKTMDQLDGFDLTIEICYYILLFNLKWFRNRDNLPPTSKPLRKETILNMTAMWIVV